MTVRGLFAVVWLAGVAVIGAGCVKTFPLEQRRCGCVSGYRCCQATNTCVSPAEAAQPSCQLPAGPDMGMGMGMGMDMAVSLSPDMSVSPSRDMGPPSPDAPPRDCATGTRRCLADGRTPQHCDEDGQWVTQLVCELRCLDGTCNACTPGARRCDASVQPQLCSAAGQWQPQAPCAGGEQCSGGVCLCRDNCDRGALLDPTAGLVDLAASSDAIWYHDGQKVWRVNPASGQSTEPHAMAPGHKPFGGLAADGAGNVFWCRQDPMFALQVMRNGAPFAAEECRDLQASASYLFVHTGGTLVRFPLAGSDGGTQLGLGAVTRFGVSEAYAFFSYRGRGTSMLYRNSVATPGEQQMVWQQQGTGADIFSVAVDADHAYFAPGRGLLRVPVAGGQASIVQEDGGDLGNVVLSESHIYWTKVELTEQLDHAVATEVYRRPKQPPGFPHRMLRVEGQCPMALVMNGDSLYLGTSTACSGLEPGRIIRLRR